MAFPDDLPTVDPAVYYDLAGSPLQQSVYEGLLRYDEAQTLVPALATSWEVSPDGLTVTFHLRRNVKFQDGSDFNAESVKTSWTREAALNKGPSYMVKLIKSVDLPDQYTVVAHLAYADSQFLAYQASLWGPKMISPKAIAEHSGEQGAAWFADHAVGTGPYRLTAFARGQQYTLDRFDGYWGAVDAKAPNQIVIRIIPSTQTQQLLLTGGQVDMITHGLPYSQLAALARVGSVKVRKFESPKVFAVYMNTQNGPLADVRLREALSWAVNRDAILRGILFGLGKVPENTYPESLLAAKADLPGYDVDKTKAQLQASGAKDLHLTYTYPSGRPVWGQIGEALKNDFAKVGVTLDLKPLTVSAMFGQVLTPKAASDLMGIDLMGDTAAPESWAYVMWDSKGPLNFASLSDPELDKAIDVASSKGDDAKRQDAYATIDKLVRKDVPALFLAWPQEAIVAGPRVADYKYVPIIPWTPIPASISIAR
jgi:peptide/nickel transport system substrate-binding protein